MLDLIGRRYVIEHVVAEHTKTMEEKAYKVYITDVVKSIAESFGASVSKRYIDLIDSEPEDERTGDEVAMEVIQRLGLKVKGGEES